MTIYLKLAEKFRLAGNESASQGGLKKVGGYYGFETHKHKYYKSAIEKQITEFKLGKLTPHHIIPLEAARGATDKSKEIAPMMMALIKKGYFSVTDGCKELGTATI